MTAVVEAFTEEYFTGPSTGSVERMVERLVQGEVVRRLWAIDPALFTAEADAAKSVPNQMGFIRAAEHTATEWPSITSFVTHVYHLGIRKVLVLACGAEAANARVVLDIMGQNPGYPEVRCLDDIEPSKVRDLEQWVEPQVTLVLVVARGDLSPEMEALELFFWERFRKELPHPGRAFVAVGEPGSALLKLGKRRKYDRVFENPADITARYSALSLIGILPAALSGADGEALLAQAHRMSEVCSPAVRPERNSALRLAAFLAGLVTNGRDKLTLILAPELRPFGSYVEHLVMGSTGKRRQGLVVIDGEPLASHEAYAQDRFFYYLRLGPSRTALDDQVDSLVAAGLPVATTTLGKRASLGAEILRWQIATALVGGLLGVNPLDETDLSQTRAGTQRFLDAYARDSVLPKWNAAEPTAPNFAESFRDLQRCNYVSITAFFAETEGRRRTLLEVRRLLRSGFRVASSQGFGARALYAAGGAYRTGPDDGMHLLLTALPEADLSFEGKPYPLSVIQEAQALAQLQLLQHHGRRVLRIHLGSDIDGGLVELRDCLRPLVEKPA